MFYFSIQHMIQSVAVALFSAKETIFRCSNGTWFQSYWPATVGRDTRPRMMISNHQNGGHNLKWWIEAAPELVIGAPPQLGSIPNWRYIRPRGLPCFRWFYAMLLVTGIVGRELNPRYLRTLPIYTINGYWIQILCVRLCTSIFKKYIYIYIIYT